MKFTKQRLIQIIKEELEMAQEGHGGMPGMMQQAVDAKLAGEENIIQDIINMHFGGDAEAFDRAAKEYMDSKYPSVMPEPETDPLKKFGPGANRIRMKEE